VQVDFWENERDKDNQHGVELALLGFDCQEANQPHSPMINRWCCEQHQIREIGLLPLHVGYLFKDRVLQGTRIISYSGLP
jgi:hypothetical protein